VGLPCDCENPRENENAWQNVYPTRTHTHTHTHTAMEGKAKFSCLAGRTKNGALLSSPSDNDYDNDNYKRSFGPMFAALLLHFHSRFRYLAIAIATPSPTTQRPAHTAPPTLVACLIFQRLTYLTCWHALQMRQGCVAPSGATLRQFAAAKEIVRQLENAQNRRPMVSSGQLSNGQCEIPVEWSNVPHCNCTHTHSLVCRFVDIIFSTNNKCIICE